MPIVSGEKQEPGQRRSPVLSVLLVGALVLLALAALAGVAVLALRMMGIGIFDVRVGISR